MWGIMACLLHQVPEEWNMSKDRYYQLSRLVLPCLVFLSLGFKKFFNEPKTDRTA